MFTTAVLRVKYEHEEVLTLIQLGVIFIMKKRHISVIILVIIGVFMLFSLVSKKDKPKVIPKDNSEQIAENDDIENEDDEEETDEPFSGQVFKQSINFIFNRNIRIVAIGDSLTQGVGDETENGGYVGIVEDAIDTTDGSIIFSNYGVRGNRTDQVLERLDYPDVKADIRRADIVLVTVGANDIMEVVKQNFTNLTYEPFVEAQAGYEERLTAILNTISTYNYNADVYLLGFYNPFHEHFSDIEELEIIVDDWNQISENVASSFDKVTYIPIKDLFVDQTTHLFAEDNFHPNYEGYQKMADRVIEYLIEEER